MLKWWLDFKACKIQQVTLLCMGITRRLAILMNMEQNTMFCSPLLYSIEVCLISYNASCEYVKILYYTFILACYSGSFSSFLRVHPVDAFKSKIWTIFFGGSIPPGHPKRHSLILTFFTLNPFHIWILSIDFSSTTSHSEQVYEKKISTGEDFTHVPKKASHCPCKLWRNYFLHRNRLFLLALCQMKRWNKMYWALLVEGSSIQETWVSSVAENTD